VSGVRLAIIGGGSAQFSLDAVRDLAVLPSLWESEVRLMDVDERRLNVAHAVAERYCAEAGAKVAFTKTRDRREALEGAQFVLNCALVGGWRGREGLWDVARRYSSGGRRLDPGVLASFRQLSLFESVARDMERVCPDAWYIQSANPMTSGLTLVNAATPIRAVGLCHGINDLKYIARQLGLDPDRVSGQAYGLNHFIWLRHFTYEGRDAYPLLDQWIEKKASSFWASDACYPSDSLGPKCVQIYRMVGLYPIGDTCCPGGGSNWPDWFRQTPEMTATWKEDTGDWMERHMRNMEGRTSEYEDSLAAPGPTLLQRYGSGPTGETNITIIDALHNDRAGLFQVNVANRASVPGIPAEVAIEAPAYVSGAGIQRLSMEPLPETIMPFVRQRVLRVQEEVETYLSRSRDRLLLAVLSASNVGFDVAHAFLDEVLGAPGNADMAAHFQ
jgi:alpha-galactosidase